MTGGSHDSALPSIADLLSLPELSAVWIEAGKTGSARTVRWLARVAVPADAVPVGAGDLVLLARDVVSDSLGPGFIVELAERGVAGIACDAEAMAVCLGPAALAEADVASLPLLALPPGVGYRELSLAIASMVFGQRKEHTVAGGETITSAGLLSALASGDTAMLVRVCLGPELQRERDWPQLRETVASYLRHGGNALAAAADAGVHRHTIRARLRRYEALSGLSLDDADARLAVAFAFRLVYPDSAAMEAP
ncbi:MAG: helix-turn-helix domain-containing protein [Spirochaetales bacterium]|nr:helix-turn-helix domain-containing protein [Spirochaetales bacterium]